ncbi:hypothetical protein ACG7TL_007536 [Trametes sanguinea]
MDAFFTIAPAVPVEAPADVPVELDSTGTNGDHGSCTIACEPAFEAAQPAKPHLLDHCPILTCSMDAFFTIAPAVPETVEDQPLETILVETDRLGTNGTHGSCVIA